MTTGTYAPTVDLGPASIEFRPAEGVVYDSTSKKYQFRNLGTYTISLVGATSPLTSTVTVVDAPTIVFDMSVKGNRDIYSQTLYGFNFTRLTTDPADDVHPTVAKGILIFSSYRDGNAELYSKPLDGSGAETRLTFTAANETDAELSPDGQHLAYVRDDSGIPRIWIAEASAANAALLTNASGATIEGSPRWYTTSDYLLMTPTALGGTSIFRTSATRGSTPTSFVRPATPDSVYDDPDVRALTSANFAVGGIHWIASAPGGPRRVHMAAVIYNGSGANRLDEWLATPSTVSLGEPRTVSGEPTVFTLFAADGSTSLGFITMTAPFAAFDRIWNPIFTPGANPRHVTEPRP
jgi:hypothetical protein